MTKRREVKQKNQKGSSSKSAQKKKRNKKKQNSDAADLRSMAFGGGNGKGSVNVRSVDSGTAEVPQEQFDTWVEHDREHVDEMFQEQLQQAILASKIESEKKSRILDQIIPEAPIEEEHSKSGKKKNKTKQKSSMSIEEFQHGPFQPEQKEEHYLDKRKVSAHGDGGDFFNEVDSGAAQIVRQNKLQEEYKKQFKVQSVLQAKHDSELEAKDMTILSLRGEVADLQAELVQVKKRNKQLCFILGQGEMKEKAEVLLQVESLSQIKDELTAQVSSLTSDLEKERSKVHALQAEQNHKSKHKSK